MIKAFSVRGSTPTIPYCSTKEVQLIGEFTPRFLEEYDDGQLIKVYKVELKIVYEKQYEQTDCES